jgi:type IV fimbrial biogenesis protein FimT
MSLLLRTRQPVAGVTLPELLVALCIVAIIATLSIPTFKELGRSLAVLGATHELMAALHTTRSAAITRGHPGVICLTDATARCISGTARRGQSFRAWINTRGESPARPDPTEPTILMGQLPPGVELRGSRASLTFWPVSRAGTTITIAVCDQQGLARPELVIVSQSGRPRLARGSDVACR